MSPENLSYLELVVALSTLWLTTNVIYRLYFHPLAKFPGPKLAIATYAYEWYYDLFLGGQYTFKLRDLHKAYGPIIRINPNEIHVNDPDFYDEIFNNTNGANKPFYLANLFGPYPAVIGTMEHDLHRIRRSAVNPFFSKRSVSELVPFVQVIIEKVCTRLEAASIIKDDINLKYCFGALTLDIMNEYCFSTDPQTVLKSDFGGKTFDDIDSFFKASLINYHLPWLMSTLYTLPDWVMRIISPAMGDILDLRKRLGIQVEDIRNHRDVSYKTSGHRTVFHELLLSKLPPSEMERERLRDEAFSLITAGSGTSAYVLSNLSYHIGANSLVQEKLYVELKGIMPQLNGTMKLQDLEKLPYLTAVIQEGLRITQPLAHRNARVLPYKGLFYRDAEIPAGTPISMTTYLVHENESIFPEPREFRPERWLHNERLRKYLLAFSRGSRSCLGINLAWAELYLIVAHIFRRFKFDVGQIVRERDIDVTKDFIMGVPRDDSKGIVVKVLKNDI